MNRLRAGDRGSSPRRNREEFSLLYRVQIVYGGHPSSYPVFTGVKRAERNSDNYLHLLPSEECMEVCLYSSPRIRGVVIG
jgi:hypothetical protein